MSIAATVDRSGPALDIDLTGLNLHQSGAGANELIAAANGAGVNVYVDLLAHPAFARKEFSHAGTYRLAFRVHHQI